MLNIKNSKLFKHKIVSSVDYNKKLPDHTEFLKLNKKLEQEKKGLLNQIKQLKADKARIKCNSIFGIKSVLLLRETMIILLNVFRSMTMVIVMLVRTKR